MNTNHFVVRPLGLLFAVGILATFSACTPDDSVMGGSGELTLSGPSDAWPNETPFGDLSDDDAASWAWDFASGDDVYGGVDLFRNETTPWRLVLFSRVADECCDGSDSLVIDLPGYEGAGIYTGDEVEVSFAVEEPWPDPVDGEAVEGRLLTLSDQGTCEVVVDEEDPLSGTLTCIGASFAFDGEAMDGLYRLDASWTVDPTPYEEAPFSSG